MKPVFKYIFGFLFLAASVISFSFIQEGTRSTAKKTSPSKGKKPETIKWLSFVQAVELNKKNPKKIFIDVYTSWCGWCKVMDKNTFTNPVIIKNINKYYYAVKLDAEMKDTVKFDNNLFVNPNPGAGRSTHQLAASLLNNRLSYPTTIYLDEKLAILTPVAGYLSPQQMEPILRYFGENAHQNKNWEDYQKAFVSEMAQ